jgi:hypothetical protein
VVNDTSLNVLLRQAEMGLDASAVPLAKRQESAVVTRFNVAACPMEAMANSNVINKYLFISKRQHCPGISNQVVLQMA